MLSHAIVIDEASSLPELLDLLEMSDKQVIISRGGRPVARMMPCKAGKPLIGLAAGKLDCPADIDFCNDEISRLFYGDAE